MTNVQQKAAQVAAPSFLLLSHTPLTDWPSLITSTLGVSAAHGVAIVLLAHVVGIGGTAPEARAPTQENIERIIAIAPIIEAQPEAKPDAAPEAKPAAKATRKPETKRLESPRTVVPVKRPTRRSPSRLLGVPTPATLAVPQIPPPEIPKPEWKVKPETVLASRERNGNPAPTPSATVSNSGGTSESGIDAPVSMEELEKGQVYTPFSQAPELVNRPEIQSYLKRRYTGRLAMSGGLVLLWILIDAKGEVRKAQVLSSSGIEGLDKAAMAAVDRMEFRPAVNKGKAVPVWVQLPVRYISE